MPRNKVKSSALVLTLLLLLTLVLSGCQQSNLGALFSRKDVTGLSIHYMSYIGEDIPSTDLTEEDAAFSVVMDALFTAEPVTLDLTQVESYSPEMNASEVLYLHTEGGSMLVYVDSYHGIFSTPMLRKAGDQQVRTYMIFQPVGENGAASPLWDALVSLEPVRPEPIPDDVQPSEPAEPVSDAPDISGFTAPDDSELRGEVSSELIAMSGETIGFESGSNKYAPETALYYAFDNDSLPAVAAGRVYLVACPDSASNQQASISTITKVDGALLVRVMFSDRPELDQNTAYIDQSVLEDGMKIVFLSDLDATVLYVQSYSAASAEG